MNASSYRQHLLDVNLGNVRLALIESECDDPVGFVIDATDRLGRQFLTQLTSEKEGMALGEVEAFLDSQAREYRQRGQFPAYIFAACWAFAEAVVPGFSPTAGESLRNARHRRPPGHYLVVVVGGEGDTYYFVAAGRPFSDGQHRAGIR